MVRYRALLGGLLLSLTIMSGAKPACAQTADTNAGPGSLAPGQEQRTRIGVLAYRGVEAALARWQPLADYLSASVPGWRFELVPLTLASAPRQIEAKGIDFLLTNPGHFVTLAERFGLSALSTRERAARQDRADSGNDGLLQYGTAIVVRKQSPIQALDDLKDRKVAAVSPDAFGGFQMAWREFQAQGIDAFHDFGSMRFMGFPQDAIVFAVLDGDADAGIVRSGLVELLAAEGRLDLREIRVLNANMQLGYPHRISSRLYPEWPFAALPGIDKTLRENVLLALLKTQSPETAAQFGLNDTWSAPLAYDEVRSLIGAYRIGTEPRQGGMAFGLFGILALAVTLAGLALFTAYAFLQRRTELARPIASAQPPEADPEMDQAQELFEKLTRRERQILALICSGHQTKSIAEKLHISPKTVEFHRTNLLHKTEAGTTPHLVQMATRLGFDQGISLG
jgi:two-component system sensor histidine kinase TtrS